MNFLCMLMLRKQVHIQTLASANSIQVIWHIYIAVMLAVIDGYDEDIRPSTLLSK